MPQCSLTAQPSDPGTRRLISVQTRTGRALTSHFKQLSRVVPCDPVPYCSRSVFQSDRQISMRRSARTMRGSPTGQGAGVAVALQSNDSDNASQSCHQLQSNHPTSPHPTTLSSSAFTFPTPSAAPGPDLARGQFGGDGAERQMTCGCTSVSTGARSCAKRSALAVTVARCAAPPLPARLSAAAPFGFA
jgi:hypothetical protein